MRRYHRPTVLLLWSRGLTDGGGNGRARWRGPLSQPSPGSGPHLQSRQARAPSRRCGKVPQRGLRAEGRSLTRELPASVHAHAQGRGRATPPENPAPSQGPGAAVHREGGARTPSTSPGHVPRTSCGKARGPLWLPAAFTSCQLQAPSLRETGPHTCQGHGGGERGPATWRALGDWLGALGLPPSAPGMPAPCSRPSSGAPESSNDFDTEQAPHLGSPGPYFFVLCRGEEWGVQS